MFKIISKRKWLENRDIANNQVDEIVTLQGEVARLRRAVIYKTNVIAQLEKKLFESGQKLV